MHEIIYLQLGNLPNFIGTHFWNAQNAYTEEEVDHSISWSMRETAGIKKEVVLRPRVMIFDKRGNFGPLQNMFIDGNVEDLELSDPTQNWDGPTQTIVEERIPSSSYLSRLEEQEEIQLEDDEEDSGPPKPTEVRYWSDYNHVYFVRDSLHAVPTIGGEKGEFTGWADGASLFETYDREVGLMDESLRRLTEDCDSLQAFQTMLHVPTFGSFGISLLQKVADEYPKCGKLDFTLLGDYKRIWDTRTHSTQPSGALLSNTLSLYHLSQLTDVSVPLLPHSMWNLDRWQELVPGLENIPYHLSAVYAAHIESITWPMRQRNAGRGFDPIVRTLNRDGITPFSCLEGVFPLISNEGYLDYRLELSLPKANIPQESGLLASYDVIRSPYEPPASDKASLGRDISSPHKEVHVRNLYPIPISHPQFFAVSTPPAEKSRSLDEANVYTSLNVPRSFRKVLTSHADWAEGYVRRGGDLRSAGIESDEAQEVIEGLRAIIERYTVDEEAGSGDL